MYVQACMGCIVPLSLFAGMLVLEILSRVPCPLAAQVPQAGMVSSHTPLTVRLFCLEETLCHMCLPAALESTTGETTTVCSVSLSVMLLCATIFNDDYHHNWLNVFCNILVTLWESSLPQCVWFVPTWQSKVYCSSISPPHLICLVGFLLVTACAHIYLPRG